MFDSFDILSGGVLFSHTSGKENDWIRGNTQSATGTTAHPGIELHFVHANAAVRNMIDRAGMAR
jgi:hypothetical protein